MKSIIFSSAMVRAILDKRKTQTRRVIKPQPNADAAGDTGWDWEREDGRRIPYGPRAAAGGSVAYISASLSRYCPYGQPGDRLWVRETWTEGYNRALSEAEGDDQNAVSIIYKADGMEFYRPCPAEIAAQWGDFSQDGDNDPRWKPSIFMPRWASRLTLQIVNVKIERLQEIRTTAIVAEGIIEDDRYLGSANRLRHPFMAHWDAINAKRGYGWDANPWVWVIIFELSEEAA